MIEETLAQLAEDPFHPVLKTHKLSGESLGDRVMWELQKSAGFLFAQPNRANAYNDQI